MGSKTSLGGAIAGGLVTRAAMGITTTACATKAGAAAGTAICPVIGTIAGAAVGWLAGSLASKVFGREEKKERV